MYSGDKLVVGQMNRSKSLLLLKTDKYGGLLLRYGDAKGLENKLEISDCFNLFVEHFRIFVRICVNED